MAASRWLNEVRSGPDGVRRVGEQLADGLDPEQARLAAFALRRSGTDEAVEALSGGLSASSERVRAAVLEVIAVDADARFVPALLARAAIEPWPWLRRRLIELLARIDDPDARAAVSDRWAAPDGGVRAAAIAFVRRSLSDLPPEPWISRVAAACTDPEPEVAWHACLAVGVAGGPAAVPALTAAVDHPNPFVAGQAEVHLSWLGGGGHAVDPDVPLSLDGLRQLREDREEDMRRAAVALRLASHEDAILAAIGRLAAADHDFVAETLAGAAVAHPLGRVRQQALRALDRHVGAPVWSALRACATSEPDPERRAAVVWSIARRTEPEAFDLLVELVGYGDPVTSAAALTELSGRVRRSARARTAAAGAALASALVAGSAEVRAIAADGLGRFGTEEARLALAQARDAESDPGVIERIRAALGG